MNSCRTGQLVKHWNTEFSTTHPMQARGEWEVSESGSRELIAAIPDDMTYGSMEWTRHMQAQFRAIDAAAAEAYPGDDAEALRRQAFFKAGSYRFIAEHALVALMLQHHAELDEIEAER